MKDHYMLISIAKTRAQHHQLLVRRQWWFLTKLNIVSLYDTATMPWQLPKGAENLSSHKHLHMDVYSSFNYITQTWK